jgi:hypothetical protein
MSTVQKATPAMFEDIHRLLVSFDNPRMREDDWRRMLFQYPWPAEGDARGYVLFDGAKAVGFIGTIFSTRELNGKQERLCNLSSWIVARSHRPRWMELLSPIVRLRSHTVIGSTPSQVTHGLFTKLGYRVLEDRMLLLPPLATPRELAGLRGASVTTDVNEIRAELSGEELRCFDDHRGSLGAHILVRRGERSCWAMATVMHLKGVRLALLQHIGDRQLFWECLPLAKWGFLKALRAPALAVDARFAEGRRVPFVVSWRLSPGRLYRPLHDGVRPELVDGLYSELIGLRM